MKKLLTFITIVIIAVLGTVFTLTQTGHLKGVGLSAPIELSMRDSLLFNGKVIKVTNTDKETPLNCTLSVSTTSGDMSKKHSFRLHPGAFYEIGMVEMQWNFKSGEKASIKTEGYLLPTTIQIP